MGRRSWHCVEEPGKRGSASERPSQACRTTALQNACATLRAPAKLFPPSGGKVERLNAAVLKTARAQVIRSSNPLASANTWRVH